MAEAYNPQDPNSRIVGPQPGEGPRNPWEASDQEKFPVPAGDAVNSPVIGLAPGAPLQPQALRGPEPGRPEFIETDRDDVRNEPVTRQVIGGKPAFEGEPTPPEPLVTHPELPAENILQKPVDVRPQGPRSHPNSELSDELFATGAQNHRATPEQIRMVMLNGAVDRDAELARLDEQLPVPNFSDPKKESLLHHLAVLLHLRG